MNDEMLNRARELLALHEVDSWLATRSEVRMASTIRDLLAEVERLKSGRESVLRLAYEIEDQRDKAIARAEAAEAACENLGVTPQQAAEGLARFKAREARIAELEARLKALCEAEPVAFVDRQAVGRVFWLSIIPDGTQLIRRPEMPS